MAFICCQSKSSERESWNDLGKLIEQQRISMSKKLKAKAGVDVYFTNVFEALQAMTSSFATFGDSGRAIVLCRVEAEFICEKLRERVSAASSSSDCD